LRAGQDEVVLDVADDGHGFDADTVPENGAGLGLLAMRDRVAEQGGQLEIDSTPGVGTRVRARFPWTPG
jgi:signal transduction histidine kinase